MDSERIKYDFGWSTGQINRPIVQQYVLEQRTTDIQLHVGNWKILSRMVIKNQWIWL